MSSPRPITVAPDSALAVERALDDGTFADVDWTGSKFAVLGVGNSQWPNYQHFPKRVDAALEATGAERLMRRAEADGQGDFEGAVGTFVRDLWRALGSEAAASTTAVGLSLTPVDPGAARAATLPEHAQRLTVVANDELVRPADGLWDFALEPPRPSTRHIQLRLPKEQSYHTGDHLAIYARNRPDLVEGAITRLGLVGAAQLRVDVPHKPAGGRFRHLPLGETVTVRQLLGDFVELSDPLPRRALQVVTSRCPDTLARLAALDAGYDELVAAKRMTLLDLLDAHPAAELSLDQLVELSAPIAPRFYSIASTPLLAPDAANLIVGTDVAPTWSGLGEHRGFASSYMASIAPGDEVFGYVRRPNPPFAPPADPQTPMILIGPGTGFAPLKGFLEERRHAGGAASLLFFGCRHPDHDWFCRAEMEEWHDAGTVELFLAFSAVPEHPWRFVQDALWAEQERVWATLETGAQVYLCGDGRFMAPAVRDTLIRI